MIAVPNGLLKTVGIFMVDCKLFLPQKSCKKLYKHNLIFQLLKI